MTPPEIQSLLLKILTQSGSDSRLGRGQHFFSARLQESAKAMGQTIRPADVMATVWALIAQGLAYLDYSQSAPENWSLHLTAAGFAAARDEEVNPDDPSGFTRRLIDDVPGISDTVRRYVSEALLAYNGRLYLAATVMLGVASEAAVLEVAGCLTPWVSVADGQKGYSDTIAGPTTYSRKFEAFRKKLEVVKPRLPRELTDNIEVTLSAVANVLRANRNAAGHPTGAIVDRQDCFIFLQMFVRYGARLYELKKHLESQNP